MMKVSLIRSYRSKAGNVTFVYGVSGNEASLEAFKKAQGEFYRESDDDGTPLWFTTRCIGERGELIITSNGKVVPDMSEFDKAASMASQYGGNFGEALAKGAAAKLLSGQPSAAVEATPAKEPVAQEENLGDV